MSDVGASTIRQDEGPDAPRDRFRGPEVCKLAGVTYRQLDYWTRTGLVHASIAQARGSGTQREYSYRDVVEVKVIKSLLDGGLSLQRARTAVEYLRDHLGEELASSNLVIDGSDAVLAVGDGEIVDLLKRGQGVLNVVPMAGVVEDLEARIHELRRPDTAPPVESEAELPRQASGG